MRHLVRFIFNKYLNDYFVSNQMAQCDKALYESIIKEVAKTVRRHIDAHFSENSSSLNESFKSPLISQFLKKSMQIAAERKKNMQIAFIAKGRLFRIYMLDDKGKFTRGSYKVPLETIKDEHLQNQQILRLMELGKLLQTDKPNTELILNKTKDKNVAALVLIEDETHTAPYYNTKEIPALALLINSDGCHEIAEMMKKNDERAEQKKFKPMEWTEKNIKLADHKLLFNQIRDYYKKYKEEYGDKLALEMTELVQKISKNEEFQNIMKKEYGPGTTKQNIQAYLYAFLLDQNDSFGFLSWMKKSKRLIELYNKFHPGKEKE